MVKGPHIECSTCDIDSSWTFRDDRFHKTILTCSGRKKKLLIRAVEFCVFLNGVFESMSHLFNHRPIRVCYLPREDNVVDVDRLRFEKALHQVAELDLVTLGSLRDPKLHRAKSDLQLLSYGLSRKSFYINNIRW